MSEEKKTIELKEEELEQVAGGNEGDGSDNPKGLIRGQSVYFYNYEWFVWMWGTFKEYKCGKYNVEWNDTVAFYYGNPIPIRANNMNVEEENIRESAF